MIGIFIIKCWKLVESEKTAVVNTYKEPWEARMNILEFIVIAW